MDSRCAPPGTPIAVVGDLNNFNTSDPVSTLVTGDITYESTYGPDSPPDWDGTSFSEARPLINGTGPDDYTFRRNSTFMGRVSHIIYSDSALDEANKFVLNTVDMTPAELAATSLQAFDATIDSIGEDFDHLPVVVDFRLFDFAYSDFNFDRTVDSADLLQWESNFALGSSADADQDGDTDGADFLVWQRQFAASGVSTSVPEPTALTLMLLFLAGVGCSRRCP